MSNAQMIAMTRRQEDGYDSFNENSYEISLVTVKVKGTVKVYRPGKENR